MYNVVRHWTACKEYLGQYLGLYKLIVETYVRGLGSITPIYVSVRLSRSYRAVQSQCDHHHEEYDGKKCWAHHICNGFWVSYEEQTWPWKTIIHSHLPQVMKYSVVFTESVGVYKSLHGHKNDTSVLFSNTFDTHLKRNFVWYKAHIQKTVDLTI